MGSSPLARGLRPPVGVAGAQHGIIPARAGFTGQGHPGRQGRRDHPRSRGVYSLASERDLTQAGSSPLARGLLRCGPGRRGSGRIIPARAGFTARTRSTGDRRTDHPRSRGVYGSPCVGARAGPDHPRSRGVYTDTGPEWNPAPGSSPLARGLRPRQHVGHAAQGIIPARAGFTSGGRLSVRAVADHPRSRGVYVRRPGCGAIPFWIIPARAGFTGRAGLSRLGWRDHPRSRGVYVSLMAASTYMLGSSPLARGLPQSGRVRGLLIRIIPARAGFTSRRPGRQRSRGGSSPLARGLPVSRSTRSRRSRIIPARAGFTPEVKAELREAVDHPRSRGVYDNPVG